MGNPCQRLGGLEYLNFWVCKPFAFEPVNNTIGNDLFFAI